MEYINISFHQFIVFFLGFIRVGTIIAIIPVFGYQSVPIPVKVGLSFFITWVIFPVIEGGNFLIPTELLPFIIVAMKEIIAGLIFGMAANFIFIGIQMAGELVGIDMGFGIVNILDPQTGEQVSIIGQMNYILSLLLFLVINGHHFLLNAMRVSFNAFPIGGLQFSELISSHVIGLSADIFKVAIQIGGPAVGALLITSLMMGILARTMPQMNIFIVGFPVKIFVGFTMLTVSLPLFIYVFGKLMNNFEDSMISLLQIMS